MAQPIGDVRVEGNRLIDPCGQPIVIRGVEQIFGFGLGVGETNDQLAAWLRLLDEIATTGANAVRLLPDLTQLSVLQVESIIGHGIWRGLVIFLTPYQSTYTWFGQPDVKAMLQKYRRWLILDAVVEAKYDDPARWQDEAIATVKTMRSYGYTNPLMVMGNQYGRDLPSILSRGPAIAAMDPQLIFGWQAYWGKMGWYQGHYGMSLADGIQRAATQPFPVQVGITSEADPGDLMDYALVMTVSGQADVGWLWWNWYNPFGRTLENLSADGTMRPGHLVDGTPVGLTSHGEIVVQIHPAGLGAAVKACTAQEPPPEPEPLPVQCGITMVRDAEAHVVHWVVAQDGVVKAISSLPEWLVWPR